MENVVTIRTDSSFFIGSGHVMRCLTLANILRLNDISIHFLCRDHDGNLADIIRKHGHLVTLLPIMYATEKYNRSNSKFNYQHWLGASWETDAKETIKFIKEFNSRWLVVDHYAIGNNWESLVKELTGVRIMAIDGLANRKHNCDVLLDPNYSPSGGSKWAGLLPSDCNLLDGPQYALLRPEFIEQKNKVLKRRYDELKTILVSFGGVDEPNATEVVIDAILELDCCLKIDVLIGRLNKNITYLKNKYRNNHNIELHINSTNIAYLMANADLAITAGGATVWELCYLNKPMVIISIADNQISQSKNLEELGAAIYLGPFEFGIKEDLKELLLGIGNNKMDDMKKSISGLMVNQKVNKVIDIISE